MTTLRAVRNVCALLLAFGAPVTLPGSAVAAATAAPQQAGSQQVCRIGDDRLVEISGLVATGTGYVVVNDGSDEKDRRRIFFLDRECSVTRTVAYPSRPRDTEDLGLAADGTLWVADIGDNSETRETIGLWKLAPGSKKPKLYRLAYPDGAHNAEALLLTPAGIPIVVTKTAGAAGLYTPDTELDAKGTTPLRRAGAVSVPVTGTSNPFSLPGRLVVTGGAVSPDGRRVVLRTYADAFEYDVPGGDLVRALTEGTPRTIPLPDEPQGESVSYSADGTTLLTVSEVGKQPAGTKPELLSYPLPAGAASSGAAAPPTGTRPASADPLATADSRGDGLPVGMLAIGALLLAGAGALGVFAARRSRGKRH